MRAVVQRVLSASVSVDGEVVSAIGRGLCVLVGLSRNDTAEDMEFIVRKILNLRLFPNANGDKRWDKGAKDLNLEILCVSQFTLYSIMKGNKLDFHNAMHPEKSAAMYERFMQRLRESYSPDKIKDGVFGAFMKVNIENDGPVTIVVDSPSRNAPSTSSVVADSPSKNAPSTSSAVADSSSKNAPSTSSAVAESPSKNAPSTSKAEPTGGDGAEG